MLDWFFQFFDRLAQSYIWKSVLSHFLWIDWVALLFLVAGVIYGIKNGLMGELGEILQLVIVMCLVHGNYEKLSFFLMEHFKQLPQESFPAVSFIVTGILTWFVVGFTASYLRKWVHTQTSSLLRMVGGAFFGGFHLILLLSFISQAVVIMPLRSVTKIYEPGSSYTGYFLARLSPKVYQIIVQRVVP